MSSLPDLNIIPVMDTSEYDLTLNFFKPLLSASIHYDRGVGYFSSGWLRMNGEGMIAFANNGGRARWVTSPILDEADWQALQTGEAARADFTLRMALKRNVSSLDETMKRDVLSALAWMVADEIITFKLALPQEKLNHGDFHDKFGIFTDAQGNQVSFNGSYNDSIQGTRNYESIKVFSSWESGFALLVQKDAERFERLWNNRDLNVRVFDLPEAAREQILRLRTGERPYKEPTWIKSRHIHESSSSYSLAYPVLPAKLSLRDYQKKAIEAWFAHQCRGLLEMATGTGKTITSLAASTYLYEQEGRLAVIIAVPYQHLVDQWHDEAKAFGYRPILAYKSKVRWLQDLNRQIMEYNAGYRNFISVIATHTTFINTDFQESIACLKGPSLLLADEAHHLGAERSRWSYPEHIPFRLALSATPDRWFDATGTEALRDYFGETVFSFPLEKAIGVSLTPYYYYPHLVSLTDEELERYQELSVRIAKLAHQQDTQKHQALEMLLIRRAKLLNNAENKLSVLSDLVNEQIDVDHTLFYCSPEQIDDTLKLLGLEKGLRVHRFTAEESAKERQQLLSDFAQKRLQALVAMKCLDEGVDVPNTHTAYFLASSGNPREFIQRRGRILRKAPGKDYSYIHDLIAVPLIIGTNARDSSTFDSERNIIRKELQRFKEFANLSQNKHKALDVIWDIAKRYGLMDF
jgi:DNA phosphorothioation system restriction enzyme